MSGLICAGDVYFNRLDVAGTPTGLTLLGNTTQFAIQESTDQKLRTSKGRSTYGQALDAVYVKKPSEITIAADEMDAANLALGLLGTVSALSQTAATVASESVTPAVLDVFVPLANGNVSAVVVTDTAGATSYTEGTDYLVNASVGMIKPLSTGTIVAAAELKVSYTAGVISGSSIGGGSQPTVKGGLILDGVNLANQKPIIIRVDQAVLTPNKAIDFLASDFAGLDLKGILQTLAGKTSPYTVEERS